MQVPQIRIHSQFAKIGMNQQFASLNIQQPKADVTIKQPAAKMGIKSPLGELTIDQSQAFAEANLRSEERRVGKECRSRWSLQHEKKKEKERIKGETISYK